MSKLTKEELKQKISDKITDNDDLVIELLEDIEDSFDVEVDNSLQEELDSIKAEMVAKEEEIASLKQKYKERFLSGVADSEEEIEVTPEMKEEEYIDVRSVTED